LAFGFSCCRFVALFSDARAFSLFLSVCTDRIGGDAR
jgi:hypothetical protein